MSPCWTLHEAWRIAENSPIARHSLSVSSHSHLIVGLFEQRSERGSFHIIPVRRTNSKPSPGRAASALADPGGRRMTPSARLYRRGTEHPQPLHPSRHTVRLRARRPALHAQRPAADRGELLLDGRLLEILTQTRGYRRRRASVRCRRSHRCRRALRTRRRSAGRRGNRRRGCSGLDRDGEEFEEAGAPVSPAAATSAAATADRPSATLATVRGTASAKSLRVAIGKSMQIRSASDRAISRNEIATRARRCWGDQGLSRHDLVPSQSEQGIDITARILESRDSETKVRVGVKMSHGLAPVVCSGCGHRGSVYRRPDWVLE